MKAVYFIAATLLFAALVSGSREQFEEFKRKYNKNYANQAEHEYRFRVFEQSLKRVAAKSSKESLTRWGVTKFSDLTPEEFKANHLMRNFDYSHMEEAQIWDQKNTILAGKSSLPSEYDWKTKGKVTPVKNQGQCGSCWDFSATETVESVWAIAGHSLPVLSEQQTVDCDTNGQDQGCDGGFPYGAYQYMIQAGGVESESAYPYTAEDGSCHFNAKKVVAKIDNWMYVTKSQNEKAMQSFLFTHSPLSVCVDAETWQDYNGGVITPDSGCGDSIDHCVQATGWSNQNNTNVWNVRNSWGTDWGENGYIYVEIGHDVCGIAEIVTVPCVAKCP
jgi:cathepsin F